MFGSKSTYFHQDPEALAKGHQKLIFFLKLWGYSEMQISVYEKAFEYFCDFPDDFDGATIVKDLYHIPGLDINAMLHDYHYLIHNAAASLYTKWYADKLYAKQMEKLGKGGASWLRFAGLKVTGIPFCFVAICKRGFISKEQQLLFFNDYETLMR